MIKQLSTEIEQQYNIEQTHLQNIVKDKQVLGVIRATLDDISKVLPTDWVIHNNQGGWGIPMTVGHARDLLVVDQNTFEKRIHVQETQMKAARQKQVELSNRLASLPILDF